MKRFKSLFGLAAGLMLAGSLLGQSTLAQPPESNGSNNQTTAIVTIASTGVFDAFFCDNVAAQLISTTLSVGTQPTSTTAGTATGSLAICYTDTKSNRPKFDTTISSANFVSGANTIPAINLKIAKTYNVLQTQYSGIVPGTGDIGAFQNEAYVAQNTGPWVWSSNQTLDTARKVQFGYAGIGTILSGGQVDLSLNLPIGTADGTYTSTLTLSIVAGSQP